jgi:TonB family protein
VPPTVLKGLRISGETQVHPSATEKTAILRDGKTRISATYRVCVGTGGEVTSVSAVKEAGYAGYDAALVSALTAWRYRPYEIGGRRVPVCGMVTFIYSMQ